MTFTTSNSKALENSTFKLALRGTAVGAVQATSPCKTSCRRTRVAARSSHRAELLSCATSAAAAACSAAPGTVHACCVRTLRPLASRALKQEELRDHMLTAVDQHVDRPR